MAKFVKGDVVVIPFPFSDLSQSKRRPALVLAVLQGDDLILCQITSKSIKDNYAIPVDENDFESGSISPSALSSEPRGLTSMPGVHNSFEPKPLRGSA
jgi:mRNA interferase MazF